VVMLGMVIGSAIGGYLPILFGASWLSLWSLLGNAIGGVIGIWVGFKLYNG